MEVVLQPSLDVDGRLDLHPLKLVEVDGGEELRLLRRARRSEGVGPEREVAREEVVITALDERPSTSMSVILSPLLGPSRPPHLELPDPADLEHGARAAAEALVDVTG